MTRTCRALVLGGKSRAKGPRFGANEGMVKSRKDRLFDKQFLARLQQLHLIAKRLTARGAGGARRSRRIGDGLEFADHRSYEAGDDIRFIDWPYYARMEKLLLRLFHQRNEADVIILLDVSASMAPGGAVDSKCEERTISCLQQGLNRRLCLINDS